VEVAGDAPVIRIYRTKARQELLIRFYIVSMLIWLGVAA
jgi:hypothetical protein